MHRVLLVDDDPGTVLSLGVILRLSGFEVVEATSGSEALDVLGREVVDVAVVDVCLPDIGGLEILRTVRRSGSSVRFVVISGFLRTRDVVDAIRLGAVECLDKPVTEETLLPPVIAAMPSDCVAEDVKCETYAAARWAKCVAPLVKAEGDLRTIQSWSRFIAVSSGALRNWCQTAGIPARRSLLFGRMLRLSHLMSGSSQSPENILNVVDRRTIRKLFQLAGFSGAADVPRSIDVFLERQTLVTDETVIAAVRNELRSQLAAYR